MRDFQSLNKKKKWIFTRRTYMAGGFLLIFGLLILGWWIYKLDEPGELSQALEAPVPVKNQVLKDLNRLPAVQLKEEKAAYRITDDAQGMEISFANRAQASEAEKPGSLELLFPKKYEEPIEIKLDNLRSVYIKDENGGGFLSRVLTDGANFSKEKKVGEEVDPASKYLQFSSQDKRKQIYYTYQRDGALGTQKLKNWIIYQQGSGKEQETYSFQNAILTKNKQGKVEVRFKNPYEKATAQSGGAEFNISEVEPDLLERAQKVIKADTGEDLNTDSKNQTPADIVIPEPYYLDKDGRRYDAEWTIENENQLKISFEADADAYPLALDPTLSFTAPGQTNTGDVISGEAAGDYLGSSLEMGDFNADGKTDLAVGASGYNSDRGRVYIFYNDGSIVASAGAADMIIDGAVSGAGFGNAIISGDFNADGKDDLVVGASTENVQAGRVYVFYSDDPLPQSAASADAIISSEGSGYYFGNAFARGDLNSDGKTDLVAAAYEFDYSTGRVYVFYNGSITTEAASGADVIITGETGEAAKFAKSITVDDFNADGKDDLAVGAVAYTTNFGRVYVFYNDGSIPANAASADAIITAEAASSYLGNSIAAGDLNGDGKTDLVVGAFGYNSSTGRVYIFHNGSIATESASGADVIINGEAGGNFGIKLKTYDYNGDSRDDLVVSSTAYNGDTGRVYVFYNDASLPSAASADIIISGESTSSFGYDFVFGDLNTDGKVDLVVGASSYNSTVGRAYIFYSQNGQVNTNKQILGQASSVFGYSLAAGDFNSDGRDDLAVGAFQYSSNAGRVYIFYNDGTIVDTAAAADVLIQGEATSSFGYALGAGDLNADGRIDLAVGANQYNSYTGRTYIFHNDGTIPTTAAAADVIIDGEASSSFGQAVVTGDLNTDGRIDLIVGSAYSTTGRVYIFYNDGSIPTTAATANLKITGEATSNLGISLAVADFNLDTRTDLLVGATTYSSNAGRVYLFVNDGSIATAASSAELKITGEATSYFGNSLAAGDFDADGRVDVLAGAYGYSSNSGRVYIFYNDGSVPTTAATADVKISSENTDDYFGGSILTGDFNADGKVDLAVGAVGANSYAGKVYIFYNDGSVSTAAASADVVISGETSSRLGASLGTADLNMDGKKDLITGAIAYSSSAGKVYVYETRDAYAWQLQRQNGADKLRAGSGVGQELNISGQVGNGYFGRKMATGDFNVDGKTDLLVGDEGYNNGVGRIYIFYNSGAMPTRADSADVIITGESESHLGCSFAVADFNLDGRVDFVAGAYGYGAELGRVYYFLNDGSFPDAAASAEVVFTGAETNSAFGVSLAAFNVDADGRPDLIVGANGHYLGSFVGRTYIFYNDGTMPTAAASADVTIVGESAAAFFGSELIFEDFNSDGRADLVVSATNYGGSAGGRVFIFYCDGTIPTAATSADVIIAGVAGGVFGANLAIGDFNSDGKRDLVASDNAAWYSYIFYNDGTMPTAATSADVIIEGEDFSNFGSSLATGDFNVDGKVDLAVGAGSDDAAYIFYNDGSLPALSTSADVIIYGEEASSDFGAGMAADDLNLDGRIDLLIGATNYNSGNGKVYLYTFNDQKFSGEANSYFGGVLSSGDLNADGKTDLVVSAYAYGMNTGRVYIFYNNSGGGTVNATGADVIITGDAISGFGSSLSFADLDANGKADLIVGGYAYNSLKGRIYVFYVDGTNDFGSTACSGDKPTTCLAANKDLYIDGGQSGGAFGLRSAVGDFNVDGKIDLAVGENGYDVGSSTEEGRVYVFYNDGSIPAVATSADIVLTGNAGESFGTALISGDLNADGKQDLVAAAEPYSGDKGRVYVFYGGSMITENTSGADIYIAGEAASNYFGRAVAVGDFNADGAQDLAVGAPGMDSYGRVYLFYMDGGTLPTVADNADSIIYGSVSGSLGASLASGDFNRDGKTDLAVGAPDYSSGAGRAYIFYNDGLGTWGTDLCSGNCQADKADLVVEGLTGGLEVGLGRALTAADFNGDGVIDLAIGVADINLVFAGRIYTYISEADYQGAFPTEVRLRGTTNLKGNVRLR
jgi:hypothetical protein